MCNCGSLNHYYLKTTLQIRRKNSLGQSIEKRLAVLCVGRKEGRKSLPQLDKEDPFKQTANHCQQLMLTAAVTGVLEPVQIIEIKHDVTNPTARCCIIKLEIHFLHYRHMGTI